MDKAVNNAPAARLGDGEPLAPSNCYGCPSILIKREYPPERIKFGILGARCNDMPALQKGGIR